MNKGVVMLGVLLGILFLIAAFIYFTTPASSLPSFLPGFEQGVTKAHVKHGIGALLLALACFAFSWFQSGKKIPEQAS